MFSVPEQFSNATKANIDAQLALLTTLAGKTFEGIEKFVELNMTVAKTSMDESAAFVKQLMTAKDSQEFFHLSSTYAQPATEKALSYGRHLANIATSTQAELARTAETQIAETNSKVMSLFEDVTKNAPAGSQNVVAMLKTVIGNANASYDQLTKTTKQAVETLEENLSSVANQMSQASTKEVARLPAKK
ncbi:phasin family protein [Undibacterium sp. Ren11W]|uniref:phasin family protein n=1 Tax=Undibacterium sp. Ren11W TaxID=3413045 RepID=UPI003BF3DE28